MVDTERLFPTSRRTLIFHTLKEVEYANDTEGRMVGCLCAYLCVHVCMFMLVAFRTLAMR